MKASEEQIRAMSQHEEGGIWPFGESKGAVNLYRKHPIQSNDYGEVREVSPNDYKQLEDLDVGVSFANITKVSISSSLSVVYNFPWLFLYTPCSKLLEIHFPFCLFQIFIFIFIL